MSFGALVAVPGWRMNSEMELENEVSKSLLLLDTVFTTVVIMVINCSGLC